jgi:tetratricopeptide (TPR) repeat protein
MTPERLALIREMLKQNPGDPFLKYAAALEHKKTGDVHTALTYLTELSVDVPDYLATYYQLGKLHEEHNRLNEAIEIYQMGILVAEKQGDNKALSELREALFMLED